MHQSLRAIRVFIAVYESRSFTVAAKRLHATQPGISQAIRALETQLGVTLLDRDRTSVVPTPAGDTYYHHCLGVLRSLDEAEQALRPFARSPEGQLTIGLSRIFTRCAVARTISWFVDAFPNVRLTIEEPDSAELLANALAGVVDFAIMPSSPVFSGIPSTFFARIPEVLVSGVQSKRTHLEPIVLPQERDLKLILPAENKVRRQAFDRYFVEHHVDVKRTIAPNAPGATLSLVTESDWSTIQPAVLFRPGDVEDPRLIVNPIVTPALVFDWVVLHPPGASITGIASLFLDQLRDHIHEDLTEWAQYFRHSAVEPALN
jgi:LysR family transcriptional regulator, nitrogen assimilation regulatory protein